MIIYYDTNLHYKLKYSHLNVRIVKQMVLEFVIPKPDFILWFWHCHFTFQLEFLLPPPTC